ncbi:MAG: beta-galactosidase [Deltaproteobacteria bacterium]|nr:beta-galactosidase [Deltaproteobacteria bacterium]
MSRLRSSRPAGSRLAAALAALLLAGAAGCGGGGEPEPAPAPAGPPACTGDADCEPPLSCATGGVHETELEPGELGRCLPDGQIVGRGPPTWPWQPGGRPLAERLCVVQGLDWGASAEAGARRAVQRQLLEQAGVAVIRLDLPWAQIEPKPGAFDFSAADPMVDAALASGLSVLGILAYGVPWASTEPGADDKYPPDDPADYAAYARKVAEHFAGRIRDYELWNEPNVGWRFFKPQLNGDAARYGKLLVAASASVREACADCRLYSAGLSFHEQVVGGALEFTHDLLAAHPGALASVDAFGLHPYTRYPPQAGPEQDGEGERALGAMVADVREVLALHGASAGLPLAATELGWPVYEAVGEPEQAALLAREVLLGASLGLGPLCWYNLVDGEAHGSFPPESDFGLYRYGSDDPAGAASPKPARDAFAWLAALGDGAKPAGPSADAALHDPGAGRFALDFDGPQGRWTALWRTAGQAEVTLRGETRAAHDLSGKVVATASGGALHVPVGPAPIYLVP